MPGHGQKTQSFMPDPVLYQGLEACRAPSQGETLAAWKRSALVGWFCRTPLGPLGVSLADPRWTPFTQSRQIRWAVSMSVAAKLITFTT